VPQQAATDPTVTALASGTWTIGARTADPMTVRRLGFGTLRLPTSAPFDGPPRERARAITVLRRAVELGVNHIDTAAFYFSATRSANELVNAALAPYPDDLLIATKVGPGRDTWGEWISARPDQLRGQVEENLRQLGRDHLDLVYLRRMSQDSIDEHFGALAELRDAGLVRQLGLSNVSAAHLAAAQAIAPVVSVQNRFGVEASTHPDVLDVCGRQGIAFVPYYAIAGSQREAGVGGRAEADERVLRVAAAHGATPAQVRLAWTLHQGPHVLAIPGTGDPAHLEQNVAAGALRLTDDEVALLGTAADGG
jgi:pyridoxine 4-dehydrogenase